MIDEALIKGVTAIANAKHYAKYPLNGKHWIKEEDAQEVLEATVLLVKMWEEKKHEAIALGFGWDIDSIQLSRPG